MFIQSGEAALHLALTQRDRSVEERVCIIEKLTECGADPNLLAGEGDEVSICVMEGRGAGI